MKKFLLLSAILGLSVPALAQVNGKQVQWGVDNAFATDVPNKPLAGTERPEIMKLTDGQVFEVNSFGEAKREPTQPLYVPTENVNPTPTNAPASGGGLFPELGNAVATQEKRGTESIQLIIDDVNIVQPALNGHAFCMGTLTLENNLNIRIQRMDLNMNYGGLNVPVSFANIAPLGGTQTQDIAWAGTYCNSMLSIPQITVKSCVASTLTREQCQSKIEYKSIENK